MSNIKTNAMRILDKAGISYNTYEYESDGAIEMIKVSDINKVTGYIRGGCCPIGMKKEYKTVLHSSCKDLNSFIISAGKIGHQIELCPRDLIGLIKCKIDSVTF